ncbi:flagellar hook-length control protein FliK [Salipiger sp. P9]|uniref:flagellar hook-length control protein FliK n=1 Tax=Salipiger pentaromativorans TaxID=2943193 RepID=UPI002158570A|nr:flagellar hook-length control protein FliK [Salipiger pentaromativorans]MCR8549496.1 flagellar hook-length control protein FliK [Salipiger pentaromativorans]
MAEPPSVPVLVKASSPVQQQTAGSVLSPVLDDSEPLTKEGTLGGLPGDARSTPAPIAAQPIALPARSETAASVLSQLSDAVAGTRLQADELIEVKLNPEELGHVRFRMGQGEHGLMLTITAERPETLDLLRRHVDQLARYLADMGHGSASFSFGERGSGGRTGPDPGQRQEIGPALPADPSPPPVPAAASGGLDIRL